MKNGLLCIGDNVVDLYADQGVYYPGGNALNVAVLARRAGLAAVDYMGILGNDAPAAHVEAAIRAEGLSTHLLRRVQGENGLARVTHDASGDRVFLGSNRGGIRRKLMLRMDADDLDEIGGAAFVHSSCFSYIEPELPRIRAAARALSFDFSTEQDPDYLGLVAPHLSLAFLSGSGLSIMHLRDLAHRLLDLGTGAVCITRGAEGAYWTNGAQEYLQPSLPAEVRDTMGAGDAFIAGYLAATIEGAAPAPALARGAEHAALACSWPGAWGHPHPA